MQFITPFLFSSSLSENVYIDGTENGKRLHLFSFPIIARVGCVFEDITHDKGAYNVIGRTNLQHRPCVAS